MSDPDDTKYLGRIHLDRMNEGMSEAIVGPASTLQPPLRVNSPNQMRSNPNPGPLVE